MNKNLHTFFQENPRIALGFSGGADSSYLLSAGLTAGAIIKPYYVSTQFQPAFELQDAKKLAQSLSADLTIIELNLLEHPQILANSVNRCYHCKKAIFSALLQRANADGFELIIDGTNASDDFNDRPGMKALSQLGVRSPLRESGLTKAEIRRLSQKAGLFTWDKPAYACLATRIPAEREITEDLLHKIEKSEDFLFSLGFSDFRVRIFDSAARLQFTESQFQHALAQKAAIVRGLTPYFHEIFIDIGVIRV
jgi:uncharacterized protein